MRQLGARLPEAPRTETPRQESLRREPARQEAVRPEPQPENRLPRPRFEELEGEPLDADEIRSHIQDQFRFEPKPRFDQSLERATGLEAVPRQSGIPWGLLEPEPEKAHRFPFLTIAVPAVAALLAVGALLWSGSMRDRLRQQDAAMNALQAQNQKMADTLEEMSVEQRASNALSASTASPAGAYGSPAPRPAGQQGKSPAGAASKPKAPVAPPDDTDDQPANTSKTQETAAAAKSEAPPEAKQEAKTESPAPRPAQEQPAAVKKAAQDAETLKNTKPVESARAPELVPPYPTNYKPLGATSVSPAGTQAQAAGVYRQPFPVNGGAAPAVSTPRSSYAQPPATAPRGSNALPAAAATTSGAADIGANYGTALAQNVDTVQGLQRHSTVPLQEFHVHEGMLTKVTPALGLSVRHPDSGHGTYSLVVNGSGGPYELRGQVNNPLVFTDNTTHREYELVVLRIADKQVYGYVRAMR